VKQFESLLYISILASIGLFGILLQDSWIQEEAESQNFDTRHDPDYYIENFTATGLDKNGKRRFVIEAERITSQMTIRRCSTIRM